MLASRACRVNVRSLQRLCSSQIVDNEAVLYSSEINLPHERSTKKASESWRRIAKSGFRDPTKKPVPVALQYLYGESAAVQSQNVSEPDVVQVAGMTVENGVDNADPVYPFALYDSLELAKKDNVAGDGDDSDKKPGGRRVKRPRRKNTDASTDDGGKYDVYDEDGAKTKTTLEENDFLSHGTSDPSVPPSNVPCGGCGAHLHCQDSKMPGFVPWEVFHAKTVRQLRSVHCQRCTIMDEHNIALKLNVAPSAYPETLVGQLKNRRAIILLIVDLVDFPGSVWPNILELVGDDKKVILVGNKVDLLPQDSDSYLNNIQRSMVANFDRKCRESGVHTSRSQIVDSILVSARTGFNVELLVSKVFRLWMDHNAVVGGDVFLVGTTNVGKSSIFNSLLDSDMCKIKAFDRVDKATTAPVPGTTLNLLKFPLMRPEPDRMALRLARIRSDNRVLRSIEEERLANLARFRSAKYSTPFHPVGQTFVYRHDQNLPVRIRTPFAFGATKASRQRRDRYARFDPDDPEFALGKWCYDTPGTVSDDQVINLLTQPEVMAVLPQLPIAPKTFLVRVGQSVLLGGLARCDVIDGPDEDELPAHVRLRVTVFCSSELPVHIVNTDSVDEFLKSSLESGLLKVPSNATSNKRLGEFPPLKSAELSVDGISEAESSCDVVLSSAGWLCFAPASNLVYKVRAWTPAGKGIYLRDPPFLPFAGQLRGRKIKDSPAYGKSGYFIPKRGSSMLQYGNRFSA